MTQAYGPAFARVYNLRWSGFAQQVAPRLLAFYAQRPISRTNQPILDLCCGTGQLARHFLEHGYRVTGLDLSEAMLAYARENTAPFVESGQARFVQGDAANFSLDDHFGLVVSTYDALNHLESLASLRRCFHCVFSVLAPEGVFIFDLNTRLGLKRWNSVNVDESDEALIITRGIYDGVSDKAFTRISGCVRVDGGLYERFEETAFNSVFELAAVKTALLETGWRTVHFTRTQDLATPIDDPEGEGRVFVVAGA